MGYFPVMLDLSQKMVVVVGSGVEAQHKVHALLDAQADIKVFDPFVTSWEGLQEGTVECYRRLPQLEDLNHAVLAILAHPDYLLNARVKSLCQEARVLVNWVDHKDWSQAIMVSQLRRGPLVIGVSTSGLAPGLARKIRQALEPLFDSEWEDRLKRFALTRADIRRTITQTAERQRQMAIAEAEVLAEWPPFHEISQ